MFMVKGRKRVTPPHAKKEKKKKRGRKKGRKKKLLTEKRTEIKPKEIDIFTVTFALREQTKQLQTTNSKGDITPQTSAS